MSLLLGFALLGSVAGYALSVTGAGIFQLIGKCFAFPCHLLIMLMDLVCSVQQAIPGSVRILGRPDLWQVLVYYAGLVCFIITIKTLNPSCFQKPGARSVYRNSAFHSTSSLSADVSGRSKAAERFLGLKGKVCALGKGIVKVPGLNRTRFISSLFLLMLILMLCFRVCPDYQFLCLDVGQGSCNLIRHGGNTYLFDAGSSSVQDVWQYRIDSTLKYYGISTLDMVFLSHGDMDHINGIEQMLELYRRNLIGRNAGDVTIDKILLPDLPQMDDRLAPIVDGAKEQGIVLDSVSAGDSFEQDNMKFSILDPSPGRMTGNSNEDCIVMMVTYKTLEILLMADLEKEGENMFVKDCPVERKQGTRILIAGHHGSKNATSDELLKVTDPDICFISCGKNNRYGHPALQMLERLQRAGVSWRRTDQEGAVGISF